jgi:DNA-binding CsgD family transcriptional regulator
MERAQQVQQTIQPDIATVAAICRLVDGNPLAIELAAGWAQVLPVADIHQEIQHCFDFLQTDRRNVPERHRSIRAVFNSSWNLLNSDEQMILMRLAFFPQSFTRDAAQQIAGASPGHLASLQYKSLLNLSADGRYGMHALIRQFAVDTLETHPAEHARIRELHSDYFASFVQEQTLELCGRNQLTALSVIQADLQNIYTGWQGILEHGSPERIVTYAFGLTLYHQMKSRVRDGLNMLTLSSVQRETLPPETVAQIDLLRGFMLIILLQNEDGVDAIWQGLQNLTEPPLWCGMALVPAVNQPELLGKRYDTLRQRIREMLEHADDTWQQAWLYKALGEFDFIAENYDNAVASFEESAARFRQVGDTWGVSWAYGNLGQALVHLRRYTQAADIYERGLAICKKIGDPGGYVDVMNKQARLALRQSQIDDAISILRESVTQALDNQISPGSLTYLLHTYSDICLEQGRINDAVVYLTVLIDNPMVQRGWRQPEIETLHMRRNNLRDSVPVDVFERAVRHGKATDLDTAIQQILNARSQSAETAPDTLIEPLTDREEDVLKLIAVGLSNQEIADKLVIAIGTVKTHAHNIYGKLAVTNRTEAAARAHELKLV